jgi:hypothetical protein
MAKIEEKGFAKFELFLKELKKRENVRLERVADYGLVEPAKRSGAIVMQPMVRVVVTAFDRDKSEILRWQEQKDANRMVTIHIGVGRGSHNEHEFTARGQELKAILVDEGYQVDDGEWTAETANALLDARKRVIG